MICYMPPPPKVIGRGQVQQNRPTQPISLGAKFGQTARGGAAASLVRLAHFKQKRKRGATSSQTVQGANFSGTKFKQTGGGQRLGGRANDMRC